MPNRRYLVAGLGALLLCASLVTAQQIWIGGGGRFAPRFAKLEDFDGQFLYCRGVFGSGSARAAGPPTTRAPTTISRFDWPSSRASRSNSM
jgi:hypothetical protein